MIEGLFQPTHLIFLLAIALLIFGPRKLPELGQGLGKGIRGFKDALRGIDEVSGGTAAKTRQ
jgi:sec-independent protein translocase protein TatA